MISNIVYGLYNLICQVLLVYFLWFANTYLNDVFIPDRFLWEDGNQGGGLLPAALVQITVLLLEAALLIALIYFFNKWYLSKIANVKDPIRLAGLTAGIYSVVTVSIIFIASYLNFR